jgi:hypothetical protein
LKGTAQVCARDSHGEARIGRGDGEGWARHEERRDRRECRA